MESNESPSEGPIFSKKKFEEEPDIEIVRNFWNQNPLYFGETNLKAGEKDFFEEHQKGAIYEYSGSLPEIFTKEIFPGVEVLDVGCGIGFWTDLFCRLGAKVNACDLSRTAVELTNRRLKIFGLEGKVRQENAENLSYGSLSFDHVNCQGVIHHTPNTKQCIEEFYRVIRPGGTLCFSVYFKLWILRWSYLYRMVLPLVRPWVVLSGRGREGMLFSDNPEDLVRRYDGAKNPIGKAYTLEELKNMLDGRFQILEYQRYLIPRRALPISIPNWFHKLLCKSLGLMIVLRCRKI